MVFKENFKILSLTIYENFKIYRICVNILFIKINNDFFVINKTVDV